LCTTRSWLVASRAYLRRAGAPATPQALAGHDCLHYLRPGDTPTWSFEPDPVRAGRSAASGGRVSVAVRGVFAANNSEALREAALAGLGIALLPDFSAQAALHAGKLQLVLPHWKPVGAFGEHLYAIRPYSPVVPRAVQAFIAYWRQALEDGFPISPRVPASRAR
jgi:DNA-binding transcriptional LysR family regulator